MLGAESFSLSLAAMDILWERLELGQHVFPFVVPSFGELMEDRHRIADAVFRDLGSRGLATGSEPGPVLTKALVLLAKGTTSVAAVGSLDGDARLLARVSVNDRTGIRVVCRGEIFHFDQIRPEALIPSVLELLPPAAPGPGYSVRFSAKNAKNASAPARSGRTGRTGRYDDDVDEDGGFRWRREDGGGGGSTGEAAQRQAAKAMFQGPKLRAGYFVAFGRDRYGRAQQATGLGWFDNRQGRYLMRSQTAWDGQAWASMAPADPARLAQQLADLVGSVR